MRITKRKIEENTRVIRGTGFNPNFKYICNLADIDVKLENSYFSMGFLENVVTDGRGSGIGSAENKAEFVEVIYNFINY